MGSMTDSPFTASRFFPATVEATWTALLGVDVRRMKPAGEDAFMRIRRFKSFGVLLSAQVVPAEGGCTVQATGAPNHGSARQTGPMFGKAAASLFERLARALEAART